MTYRPKPIDTSAVELPKDITALIELLAENNHETWAQLRIANGWTYGPRRNDDDRKHPNLIPFSDLPHVEKMCDRKTAIETLKYIMVLGYRIDKIGAQSTGPED